MRLENKSVAMYKAAETEWASESPVWLQLFAIKSMWTSYMTKFFTQPVLRNKIRSNRYFPSLGTIYHLQECDFIFVSSDGEAERKLNGTWRIAESVLHRGQINSNSIPIPQCDGKSLFILIRPTSRGCCCCSVVFSHTVIVLYHTKAFFFSAKLSYLFTKYTSNVYYC